MLKANHNWWWNKVWHKEWTRYEYWNCSLYGYVQRWIFADRKDFWFSYNPSIQNSIKDRLSYLISIVIWGNKEATCPHLKRWTPVHDWDSELGQCIPDPPVTDCSIVVTNDASTDMFLRVATEIRSRWAKTFIMRRINTFLAPQLGKT